MWFLFHRTSTCPALRPRWQTKETLGHANPTLIAVYSGVFAHDYVLFILKMFLGKCLFWITRCGTAFIVDVRMFTFSWILNLFCPLTAKFWVVRTYLVCENQTGIPCSSPRNTREHMIWICVHSNSSMFSTCEMFKKRVCSSLFLCCRQRPLALVGLSGHSSLGVSATPPSVPRSCSVPATTLLQ